MTTFDKSRSSSAAALFKKSAVRVVDVAAALRRGLHKFTANLKMARNGAHIVLQIHVQSFSG
jgi:hypothetical protein